MSISLYDKLKIMLEESPSLDYINIPDEGINNKTFLFTVDTPKNSNNTMALDKDISDYGIFPIMLEVEEEFDIDSTIINDEEYLNCITFQDLVNLIDSKVKFPIV